MAIRSPAVTTTQALEKHLGSDLDLDENQLAVGKSQAGERGIPLLDALEDTGCASADQLYRSLARYCEMPFVVASKLDIPKSLVENVPARYATHYGFVPTGERNGAITIAISDPLNTHLLDDIRLVLKKRIEPYVATPKDIEQAMKELYGLGADTMERIIRAQDDASDEISLDSEPQAADLGDDQIDASIVKFVNEVFMEAIKGGATDIHIEPFEDELRVRYRIDGVLHQIPTPSTIRGFQGAIVSRVKVMANMNIAEKRLPQDGKIQAALGEAKYDLRVSILPTPHGETVNIRILTRASMFLSLEDLGFHSRDLDQINSFIKKPHGIILVTGPTGSGKSTTLYASLNKLNDLDRKTITIEDPIEYQMAGITQMQVLPQIGFSFSTGLRAMLRHDPDIMMVGEIRDYETAEMAIRSSLTGHLVFSTLHTNDAAGAVTRLADMGVEPFLIASTMIASIAQRLVRKNCEHCAEEVEPDTDLLREIRVSEEEIAEANFRKGSGCDLCRQTGYAGRIAISEILPFTEEIKELTVNQASSSQIRKKGCEEGMNTLREAGWARVKSGGTTLEEIVRVTADADVMT